jgi:hypothetical protein
MNTTLRQTATPLFTDTEGRTFPSGTAFLIEFGSKQYLICPLHLVGEGFSSKVTKVTMMKGEEIIVVTGPCINKEIEDLDLMIFEVMFNGGMTPFKLADKVAEFGSHITLLPSNIEGSASNSDDELTMARLERGVPIGSSGSAMVNEAGELVSMYIGARNQDRIVIHGVATAIIRKTLLGLISST